MRMDLSLDAEQQQKLLDYLSLLDKWNRTYNLTAVRDPAEMVSRQLLDSLSILPLLSGREIADVGTGPGLPGIPLAVARPELRFTLLDSNGKKCRFVQQAKIELRLHNLTVVRSRVEQFVPDNHFDMVLSRAFASLPDMLELSAHLLASDGCMLAMKGALHQEEIDAAAKKCSGIMIHTLKVPDTKGERHAIVFRKVV
ncbi:MAG: 16S rRNA (guanine(527)-N(7))-methyltransferase RsmG [Gammaproteobacteria bacterium]|nr:16S rRNA (guanine(527)-N(7))-methyltransferase RsmG [Gammaproteobacteria bacterium]HXK55576.1 16S rRNA (guanine(527)-N(7))-methyltransferase RsmG [Gammaproteobacteria bacterium]